MRQLLISDARSAWRYVSMHVAAVAVLFGALPAETQTAILDMLGLPASRLPAVLGLAMIVARLVQQPLFTEDKE
jgi:hypothetical protein